MRIRIFSALILTCAMSMVGTFVYADDNGKASGESSVKAEDVKESTFNKVGGEDADEVLTNNKLRAESGSKSRFSVASQMAYNGGTITHPFGDHRPNIQDVTGDSPVTSIQGGVNLKYNMTQLDSVLLGGTARWITPQSHVRDVPAGYAGQKMDFVNPSINYQRIYKIGNIQSYVQVGPGLYTQTDLTAIGYIGNLGAYNVNAYDIGHTGFTIGLETGTTFNYYKTPRNYPGIATEQEVRENSADYQVFTFPYVEYKINDKVNLRSVMMFFSMEHTLATRSLAPADWHKDKAMQSFGVGYSVTRDVFLYPNVQFIPDQTRVAQTNVGIEADVNLF